MLTTQNSPFLIFANKNGTFPRFSRYLPISDPCDDCIFRYMNVWFLWFSLVGKYTVRPMDRMDGLKQIHQGKSRWHSHHVLDYKKPCTHPPLGDRAMYFDHRVPSLRILTPPMETPDPPTDTPKRASKKVFLTPHDIPRILRVKQIPSSYRNKIHSPSHLQGFDQLQIVVGDIVVVCLVHRLMHRHVEVDTPVSSGNSSAVRFKKKNNIYIIYIYIILIYLFFHGGECWSKPSQWNIQVNYRYPVTSNRRENSEKKHWNYKYQPCPGFILYLNLIPYQHLQRGAKWFRFRVSIHHPLGFNWRSRYRFHPIFRTTWLRRLFGSVRVLKIAWKGSNSGAEKTWVFWMFFDPHFMLQ